MSAELLDAWLLATLLQHVQSEQEWQYESPSKRERLPSCWMGGKCFCRADLACKHNNPVDLA
eukprot:5649265-Amphidinium_carterae.1